MEKDTITGTNGRSVNSPHAGGDAPHSPSLRHVPTAGTFVKKRDASLEEFDPGRISKAILKALHASPGHPDGANPGSDHAGQSVILGHEVCKRLVFRSARNCRVVELEEIQDMVEEVLMASGLHQAAKAFIVYRERRKDARNIDALMDATRQMFDDYLEDRDWRVRENANTSRSVNGLNNYVREVFTADYWLHAVYPGSVAQAHRQGSMHIHDLGFFGPYCAGWDLRQLLIDGFGGVEGKVSSRPARHLRSFLGQIVNATFTTQGECAGAQAWSGLDTWCAPFIRHDGLGFSQVKQALQEFVFNINVPTRVGFQCPFSNVTLDVRVPKSLQNEAVIIGGQAQETSYGDYQAEMDMFNLAFLEVMEEGDSQGRVFTFPIPTVNITRDFPWDSPVADALMRAAARYGIPYFANFVTSTLSPEDAVSMCCRLRLDTSELKKRGGGLFGSNPLTGSIGVVTLNLPQLAWRTGTRESFLSGLDDLVRLAADSLEIKRKLVERETDRGLYPYAARFLRHVKARTGTWWGQHFSTIGIIGMHEALLNLGMEGIQTPDGQEFALRVMDRLRDLMTNLQESTGHQYNLEATPAEGTAYRLASLDVKNCPGIITAGKEFPYYCNSTQLPVDFTDDIHRTLELQDSLQSKYTGGTVLHLYLAESPEDWRGLKTLVSRIFATRSLPYLSISPTFSVCPEHGYLRGEVKSCPVCQGKTEVWTRVVGYLRPVGQFNPGKLEERKERVHYVMS